MNRGVLSRTWGGLLLVVAVGSTVVSWSTARAEEERKPWTAPRRYARKRNPVKVDEASLARGKQLFVKHCLSCHGLSGAGDGPAASGLDVHPGNLTDGKKLSKQPDGEIYFKIRTGRRPMTAFKDTLKSAEIWTLVNYVRTLAGGKVVARATWYAGRAPRLSDDLRPKLGTVVVACLKRYAALRDAVRKGDGGQVAAGAAAVSKELAGLGALGGGDSFRKEISALLKLVAPHLDGMGKAAGDASAKHLSELSSRLGELLGRYAPELPEVWTLYLYDTKKQGSLYWLQGAGKPANPFASGGAAAVAAATFGKAK